MGGGEYGGGEFGAGMWSRMCSGMAWRRSWGVSGGSQAICGVSTRSCGSQSWEGVSVRELFGRYCLSMEIFVWDLAQEGAVLRTLTGGARKVALGWGGTLRFAYRLNCSKGCSQGKYCEG